MSRTALALMRVAGAIIPSGRLLRGDPLGALNFKDGPIIRDLSTVYLLRSGKMKTGQSL